MPSMVGLSSLAIEEQTAGVLKGSVDIDGESPCVGPGDVESNKSEPRSRWGPQHISPVLLRPYMPHLSLDLKGKLPCSVLLLRHKVPLLMQSSQSDTCVVCKGVCWMALSTDPLSSFRALQMLHIVAGWRSSHAYATMLPDSHTGHSVDRGAPVRVVHVQDEHMDSRKDS